MDRSDTTDVHRTVWFYDLQLSVLPDGSYRLYVAENSVDEEEKKLLYRELLDERMASIDDLLTRLRQLLAAAS